MRVIIKGQGVYDWINSLSNKMGVAYKEDCQLRQLTLTSKLGSGSVMAYQFSEGLGLLIFDCTFKENTRFVVEQGDAQPMGFHFCLRGEFRHFICGDDMRYQLNPLMGSIMANPTDCPQTLLFPKKDYVLHAVLYIDRAIYLEGKDCEIAEMPEKLSAVFKDAKGKDKFLYISNYSIPTANCIQEIVDNTYKGFVKSVFEEAKALELLSFQLQQFKDDHHPKARFTSIKKYDASRIVQAAEHLIANLEKPPTIVELAKKVGINQQKLKKGFKEIYKTTIRQYLLLKRLEAARLLLMDGSLTINQVAETVGYNNAGYFARRFQEKYGLLPNEFRSKGITALDTELDMAIPSLDH